MTKMNYLAMAVRSGVSISEALMSKPGVVMSVCHRLDELRGANGRADY